MADTQEMQGTFHDLTPDKDRVREGVVTTPTDPLSLSIEDEELSRIADEWIADTHNYYETHYDLYERRKNNEMYYFGRQIMEKEKEKLLKSYDSRFQDNVLWEIAATLKPLAMSRIPDLIVLPGNDSDDAKLMSQEISKAIDTELKERNNRKVLGIAFQHRPIYFTGVIKAIWDNEMDDYKFVNIHPNLIDVDRTCPTNDADEMVFVSQIVPMTVQNVLLKFPAQREKFLDELAKDGIQIAESKPTWKQLATEINIREIWFTEYKRHKETEVERIDGVFWKYKDCILKKMKNPNFDFEGDTQYMAYDDISNPQSSREVNPMEMMGMMAGIMPPNVKSQQTYNNYFRKPKKPFFFMGYDQWGKQPLDETSWLEQNIFQQKSLDKRGKQIDETLDQRGHHIFSKDSGLKPADIQAMDFNDPDQDLIVEGSPRDVHEYIEPQRPTPPEFENLKETRDRMYQSAGANAVQGEMQSDTATTNQIAREANFTRADDMVEDTINSAAEWMAGYALQFMKLRYTTEHFRWILGDAGEPVYIRLHQNMISDGMIVKIKASGTDKLRAQNNAMDMAKMEMIDPFTFYKDMALSDPEGRTENIMDFKMNPQAYMAKVVKGLNSPQAIGQALMSQPVNPAGMNQPGTGIVPPNQPPPPVPGVLPQQTAPQNPTPQNTAQVPVAPPSGAPMGSPRNI